MANPFTTRATEFLKSNEAFLALISPEPISFFLEPYARDDGLYRRLVSIQGQPGSGKTTIARLFEFSTLATLLRGGANQTYSELIGPLQKCGAIRNGQTQIVACRLPLESDYRELWQLPYSEEIRNELMQRLIQARAILAWFSQLRKANIQPSAISLEVKQELPAATTFVGGSDGEHVFKRAKAIEAAIYRIIGALVPPIEGAIEREIIEPYRPFGVIDGIRLTVSAAQQASAGIVLRPIVILDDAHFLHAPQLENLKTWLVQRELVIGRWILSRLDVLQPKELFESLSLVETDVSLPGITAGRDIVRINLQSGSRTESRRNFRTMARGMSRKYLGQMKIFADNAITDLGIILPEKIEPISASNFEKLVSSVKAASRRFHLSIARVKELETMIDQDLANRSDKEIEIRWAMLRILVHRYAKRTPQTALFPDDEGPDPSKPLRADITVYDGARIQLLHDYNRPYYVGFDALSDAASENIETFLHLASHIVQAAENLLIKQKSSAIRAPEQQALLTERAKLIIDSWNFPEHRRVRGLTSWIADRCKTRTLERNAPLGAGANAFGIRQDDFARIEEQYPTLAHVLKFAVAYNALTLIPNYPCKEKVWCLLELGGVSIVQAGLPFKRGGFVEGTTEDLNNELQRWL
ncbi:MAG TPA: hypothetical protein VFA58_07350 [Chthoniobacterales bacterium]|nr:hypothetical protein [Chthoniobacterales bacterium]